MRYWLMKSEPSTYSIDDLARDGRTLWTGVRNYQARNFMRDEMQIGDGVLFYHSSCDLPGIVGLAEVSRLAVVDETQFDPSSHYFDEKASPHAPRWFCVEIAYRDRTRIMPLDEMRACPELGQMKLLQRGNRLSITPVAPDEWAFILDRLKRV